MKYFSCVLVSLFITSCNCVMFSGSGDVALGRKVVGATAVVNVKEADMDFLSRVDTGARTTSIHAEMVRIHGGDKTDLKKNIGKKITFDTVNHEGKKVTVETVIKDVSQVKNSQGVEPRYVVALTVGKNGDYKVVDVNLRNRSKMEYKFLIGRNWLTDDYIVDIDK